MVNGGTDFSDVFYDLVSVQYHALKASQHYGQYVRDARNGGSVDRPSPPSRARRSRATQLPRVPSLIPHSRPPARSAYRSPERSEPRLP